jgi:hypothetical protein
VHVRWLQPSFLAALICLTWGAAGGDDEGFNYYRDCIAEVSGRYEKVLMLGDSMGELHPVRMTAWLLLDPSIAAMSCTLLTRVNCIQSQSDCLSFECRVRLLPSHTDGMSAGSRHACSYLCIPHQEQMRAGL